MNRHVAAFVTLLVVSFPAFASGADQLPADRAALLAGVAALPFEGTPGQALVLGADAVAVAGDAAGFAFVVAARHGAGRVLLVTHDSLYKTAGQRAERTRFLGNAVAWLTRGRTPLKVFALHGGPFVDHCRRQGIAVDQGARLPADLSGYVLVHAGFPWEAARELSSADEARLRAWVAAGGGLAATALGWVWRHYAERGKAGAPLFEAAPNRLLAPLGIVVGEGYGTAMLPLSAGLEAFLSRATVAAGLARLGSEAPAEPAWLNRLLFSAETLAAAAPDVSAVIGRADAARVFAEYSALGDRVVPAAARPVKPTDARAVVCIALVNALVKRLPPDKMPALRHAAVFPGAVADGARPATARVPIDAAGNGRWQSTGRYAPPGALLTINVPGDAWRGLAVVIGCHADRYPRFDAHTKVWRRWPDVSVRVPLRGPLTRVASPHGGLVYLDAGAHANLRVELEVTGAVAAPRFVLGKTTTAEWTAMLAESGAPWGEIEGQNLVIGAPLAALRAVADPAGLAAWWDRVAALYPPFSGQARHPYKERFVPDEQPWIGYMHSGYPVVTHLDVAAWVVGADDGKHGQHIFREGSWGHFHELGHNYQRGDWTWSGAGEVTVNLFTLHAMEHVTGRPAREHKNVVKARQRLAANYPGGLPFADWGKDPFAALVFFVDLVDAFGWDLLTRVFREYEGLPAADRPKNDADKRDQWLVRCSLAAGRNLTPHFTKWHVPVSAAAVARVRHLPAWGGR